MITYKHVIYDSEYCINLLLLNLFSLIVVLECLKYLCDTNSFKGLTVSVYLNHLLL